MKPLGLSEVQQYIYMIYNSEPGSKKIDQYIYTRQLPIGAGHFHWGGFIDRNVFDIH